MLTSDRNLLKSRVNTIIGSLLIFSWMSGCGLMIWTISHNENPVATVFAKLLYVDSTLTQ